MSTTTQDFKQQLITKRYGLWLFIMSESVLFLALLLTRFFMTGVSRPEELNQPLALGITIMLLVSSFTANRAEVHISQGNQKGFLRNLAYTMMLGLVFLGIVVAVEWPEAAHFAPLDTAFGTVFYVITGMHAFHVLTGLIILVIVYFQGRAGRFTKEDYWTAQAGIIYWHFVDIVWVFVYPILYLLGP